MNFLTGHDVSSRKYLCFTITLILLAHGVTQERQRNWPQEARGRYWITDTRYLSKLCVTLNLTRVDRINRVWAYLCKGIFGPLATHVTANESDFAIPQVTVSKKYRRADSHHRIVVFGGRVKWTNWVNSAQKVTHQ